MLRISRLADYGTVIMTQMADEPERVHSAAGLASALGLGVATVSKILKQLARHELVTSQRGARGGYVLARPAQSITLADIIQALDDKPFGLTECSATGGKCDIEAVCRIRFNWVQINIAVRRALDEVSLEDMLSPSAVSSTTHPIHGPESRAGQPLS